MSTTSQVPAAAVDQIPADIEQLGQLIAALPAEHRSGLSLVYDRVLEGTRRRRRIMNLVQEALSQLRLDMKYLMFDLEATRRERDEYRRQIDETKFE